jgi:hypothetical protein
VSVEGGWQLVGQVVWVIGGPYFLNASLAGTAARWRARPQGARVPQEGDGAWCGIVRPRARFVAVHGAGGGAVESRDEGAAMCVDRTMEWMESCNVTHFLTQKLRFS